MNQHRQKPRLLTALNPNFPAISHRIYHFLQYSGGYDFTVRKDVDAAFLTTHSALIAGQAYDFVFLDLCGTSQSYGEDLVKALDALAQDRGFKTRFIVLSLYENRHQELDEHKLVAHHFSKGKMSIKQFEDVLTGKLKKPEPVSS